MHMFLHFRVLITRAFPGRSNSRRFAGKVSVSRGWSFTLPLESERLVFYPTPRIRGVGAANLSVSRGWSFTLPLESETATPHGSAATQHGSAATPYGSAATPPQEEAADPKE